MTARLVLPAPPPDGVQPLDLGRHLAGVADLIELCFASEMDDGGRGFIRELRTLSHLGPLLPLLVPFGLSREIWTQGFVWTERGRVAGSVSTQPAGAGSATWLIANVAVHPDFRRRGIARLLMQATLEHLRAQGAAEVILQVDDDNLGAITLYRQLGFTLVATHATWTRPGRTAAPDLEPAPAGLEIRPRADAEWLEEYNLASLVRPEGLVWNRPLHLVDFRPNFWRAVGRRLDGLSDEHWVAVTAADRQVGAVYLTAGLTEGDRLILLVHPGFRGQVERPLLIQALHRLPPRPAPVRVEHRAQDETAETALRDLGFRQTRVLRWLRREVR